MIMILKDESLSYQRNALFKNAGGGIPLIDL